MIILKPNDTFYQINRVRFELTQHIVVEPPKSTKNKEKFYFQEYKAEINCDALCCAVAEVEIEHQKIEHSSQKHIDNLENQIKQYQKMIDLFIDSKKVITNQEIEDQIDYTFPLESDNTHIRDRQIMRNAIQWYRNQLNKK